MKTKLPLNTESQLPIGNPVRDNIRLGWPFNIPKYKYSVALYESDLQYINAVIKSDKMYRFIKIGAKKMKDEYNNSKEYAYSNFVMDCNIIDFFEKFMDDEKCPKRVKLFFWQYLGDKLTDMKDNGTYKYYVQRSFLTQKWMEKCR